jgi:hypothetical protein
MGTEETSDGSVKEFAVEVTAEPLGPAAGINKESPEGIFDGGTGEIREAIAPAILGGEIDQHKAVSKTAGAGAVTIANVGANGVQDSLGTLDGAAARTTLDGGEVAECRRRFSIRSHVQACPEMREKSVIQFATAKHAFEIGGRVAYDGRGSGFGDVLGRNNGFVKSEGRVGWLDKRRRGGTSVSAAASDGVMQEAATSGATRLGGRGLARLVVIKSDVGATRGVWDHTILVVINGDGKGWESEPATRMVADEAASITTAAVNANGKKWTVQCGDMIDATELDGILFEFEPDSANAGDGNTAAIGEGDGKIKMCNVPIGGEVAARVPQVPRGAGVDTAVVSVSSAWIYFMLSI